MAKLIPKGSTIVSFIYKFSNDLDGYEVMDKLTIKEVKKNKGYLGHEVFKDLDRNIFLSYWKDGNSIKDWKNNNIHKLAKKEGTKWYEYFNLQISELKNDYYLL